MSFMKKLIASARDRLNGEIRSDSLFLFPSKRAVVFFNKALKEENNRFDPFLFPHIDTLSDWIIRSGGWQPASGDSLLLTLYQCYQQAAGESAQTFEQFYPQSRTILADLLEFDKACLTREDIRNITRNALSSGRPDSQFNRILKLLPDLHDRFNEELLSRKTVHYPLALKTVLGDEKQVKELMARHSAVFLGGFYPIDQAEINLFSLLSKEPTVTAVWDDDRYFTEFRGQEAALLFKNASLFPDSWRANDDEIRSNPRTITLIETQGSIAQAKSVGLILEQLGSGKGLGETDTALVLPQEQMLLPLLSAVPEELEEINITMGYPLSQSLMSSLFRNLSTLQSQIQSDDQSIPFKALFQLLTHPEWAVLIDEDRLQKLHEALSNRVRALERFKAETLLGELAFLLSPPKTAEALCLDLHRLLESLKDVYQEMAAPHKLELLNQIRRQVLAIERLTQAEGLYLSVQTAWQILMEKLDETKLPFSGEPLLGLQIMGMLETRCLDFKNLIFLSFNEGAYPQGRSSFSLIPDDLKRLYKMASYREYDALQAYNFYRLLKRGHRIWLLYDGSGRGEQGAEPSRFIRQIEHEMVRNCPETRFLRQTIIQSPPPLPKASALSVPNSERLRRRWQEMEFSATAINTHHSCSLRFFYRYGLKVKEPVRQNDAIDPLGIGQITHSSLEMLYRPYRGQTIDARVMESIQQQLEPVVVKMIREYFPGLDINQGRPFLESTILTELLKQVFTAQSEEAPFVLHAVEKSLDGTIRLADGTLFRIGGKFDRIDQTPDGWRIVDYKSGRLESSSLNPDKIPDRYQENDPFNHKAIVWQLLLYQWLFCLDTRVPPEEVSCAVLSLRSPHDGFITFGGSEKAREIQNRFSILLDGFFSQLNDPEYTFTQTDKTESCTFCPFRELCHR